MKKYLTSLFFLLFCITSWGQQINPDFCGDDKLRELLRHVDTGYDLMQQRSNLQLKNYMFNVQQSRRTPLLEKTLTDDSSFIIPVVVHIVYPYGTQYGSGNNISYAQVRSQIEALNAAFAKNYPAYNGQAHPVYGANAHIRFCLARNTQDTSSWAVGPGGIEFGVRRYADKTGAYNHTITQDGARRLLSITHPSAQNFSFEKYLNIWVVSNIDGCNSVMGYAPKPIMPGYLLDGIVMRADIFGDNTTGGNYNLGFGLSQGKILAHEAGHYFNLYHIFQGGCSGTNASGAAIDACDLNGDMICDIEPSTTQNIFCTGSSPNTCNANYATGTVTDDMINDYMSYADDDCMNTFTLNQSQRMWATLHLQRTNIWQPENLAATGVLGTNGCVPSYLNAQINTADAVFCAGSPIRFINPAAGNTATSYHWEFTGGSLAVSTAASVSISYAKPGNYKALLKVSDGLNTRTDSLLFAVLECKLDSSMLSMAHWYFGNFGSLDFTAGTPVQTTVALKNRTMQGESAYPGQLPFIGSTISLSDSLGNLLFYSNGVSVWNKDHRKITTSPMFGASDINASSGFCYIPFPGKKGKYFAAGAYPNFNETPSGVRFVQIDADSNSVSLFEEFSHPSLPKRFSQFLTVVPHCNGTDYWIITKGFSVSDTKFYSFLVTTKGIDAAQAPVISNGFLHPGYGGSGDQLKANRQGNKLLLCSPHGYLNIETGALYDFDSRTGEVTNEKVIPNLSAYSNIQGGGAFSPNGKYFYLARSTNFATNGPPYWLFQYRVSDMAYNVFDAPGFYFAASYQPGPDNKIYITTQENKVAQIAAPDEWGNIAFNSSFINMMALNNEIRPNVSIPSFIDARRREPAHPDFSVFESKCNTFLFSSLCFDNLIATWNFGDSPSTQVGNTIEHHFNNPGVYNVTLTLSAGSVTYGSVSKKTIVLPLFTTITGPETICTNYNFPTQYSTNISAGAKYKWAVQGGGSLSGPDDLPFVNIVWSASSDSSVVQLNVTRDNCFLKEEKKVSLFHGPLITWAVPDSTCLFDSVLLLHAMPAGGNFTGPGIINNILYPSLVGEGYYTVTYTYFNESACLGQAEKTIKVARCKVPANQNTDCSILLNSISIAPNPVKDLIQLKSPYALKFVQVYNAIGQKITEGILNNNSIHLPYITRGIYTILVYCEKNNSFKALRFYKL